MSLFTNTLKFSLKFLFKGSYSLFDIFVLLIVFLVILPLYGEIPALIVGSVVALLSILLGKLIRYY